MTDEPSEVEIAIFKEAHQATLNWKVADAVNLLKERLPADPPCPMCGNRDWRYEIVRAGPVVAGQPAPAYIYKTRLPDFEPPPTIPVIVYTCSKCAFVRQHNLAWIAEELAAGPKNG